VSQPENTLAVWAELLFDALAAAGVTDVVVSPGSRSTPFVLAAAADPRLRLHDVIDERAAAFFALGQARVSGRPSLLLCTSGTAAAHYLPAVIEARHAGIPMLLLTADRPVELHGCGANQTIDQRSLFAAYARASLDLGIPDASPAALHGLRRAVVQAVHATRWPAPGAAHLNAPARKPLEPRAAATPEGHALAGLAAALRAQAPTIATRPIAAPDPATLETIARLCLRARRGLIVAGPAGIEQARAAAAIAQLSAATGFALAAEATSQLRGPGVRTVGAFDLLFRSAPFRAEHGPDLVLQLGAAPTSGGFELLLSERPDLARVVIAPHDWPDPYGGASYLLVADVADAADGLGRAVMRLRGAPSPEPSPYASTLAAADALSWRLVDADLAASSATLEEGAVVRQTVAALHEGAWLAVGNSLAVRHLDTFCPSLPVGVRVLSQRGASGIDGLVAGAAGAASATDRPVTLLLGDVSFLHDVGGLALARHARVPLVIVVINNDGGRIFEQLPLARSGHAAALPHFTTPHGLDLSFAAELYGLRFLRASSRDALAAALHEAHGRSGCTVVEAVVPPHAAAQQQMRLQLALESALGGRR
jgi:2-succinyl-5-enolpyruvyl-6-hydroxy-3-cyclohexene-1-carboxylate synthase